MREARRLLAELLERPDVRPMMQRLLEFDGETYRHSLRVARFAIVLARTDQMEDGRLRQLAVAAMLHDLGKTRIPPELLHKPGPLDHDEKEELRRHPAAAVGDLQTLEAFPDAHRIAPLHHEGHAEEDDAHAYPRSGADRRDRDDAEGKDRRRAVPAWMARAGRILALADRYDALISRRAYKDPWPDAEVRRTLNAEMPDVAGLLDGLVPPERPPR